MQNRNKLLIQVSLSALILIAPMAVAQNQYNMMSPGTMSQYNMAPSNSMGMTTSSTTTTNSVANMGQPVNLSAAPALPGLPNYVGAGKFISGHGFPNAQPGPVYLMYLSSAMDPTTVANGFQSVFSSNGWQLDPSGSGTGSLSATYQDKICKVTVSPAFGISKARVYIDYRTNPNYAQNAAMPGQTGVMPGQTGVSPGTGLPASSTQYGPAQ